MTTELEIEKTNLPAVPGKTTALAALDAYLDEADPQNMIGKLLKFSKGKFLLGQDAEVIPEGALYVVACDMALVGFVRWDDGKPVEHKLSCVTSGAPRFKREQLGHNDKDQWPPDAKGEARDPWQEAIYLPLMDHDGEICTFTTSSKSGVHSVNRLLRRYATHAARHPDQYPLVKLKKVFWVHKDRAIGKIFFPEFEPAGYVERADFVAALELLGVGTTEPEQKALPDKRAEFNDGVNF
jgi:hypothetical protein